MKVVKLFSFQKEFVLRKGDQCKYTYHEHVSVGYTADFEIEDSKVLKHLETNTRYEQPERMKHGMAGGDAAETTFVFQAESFGTSLLWIRKYFRFDLEEEMQFRIIVK